MWAFRVQKAVSGSIETQTLAAMTHLARLVSGRLWGCHRVSGLGVRVTGFGAGICIPYLILAAVTAPTVVCSPW